MNNKKSLLIAGATLALSLAVAFGSTLAYFTDTDEETNVFTIGDVEIDQIEEERDSDGKLVDFTQAKPLNPTYYEGTSIPWAPEAEWIVPGDQAWKTVEGDSNVVDKFVTVENTGKNGVYLRTVFAIEVGKDAASAKNVHIVHNGSNIKDGATWTWEWIKDDAGETALVEIDGNFYRLYVATYTEVLTAGDTTIPSLKQIYMDKTATEEEVAAYGDTFEIIAFTQAVQSDSFADEIASGKLTVDTALDAAFGDITATAHPWADGKTLIPTVLTEDDDLAAELANGGSFILSAGDYRLPTGTSLENVTLVAANDDVELIVPNNDENVAYITAGDNVTIKGIKFDVSGTSNDDTAVILAAGENITVEACSFDITDTNYSAIAIGGNTDNILIKDCDFNGGYKHIGPASGTPGDIVIDGCTFDGADSTYGIHLNVTSNDLTVKNSTIALFNTIYGTETSTGVLTFENCDFVVEAGKTNVVKLYRDVIFTDCDFADGFLLSGSGFNYHDFDMTFNGGTWENYASIKDFVLQDNYSNDVTATFNGISYVQTAANPGVWTQK